MRDEPRQRRPEERRRSHRSSPSSSRCQVRGCVQFPRGLSENMRYFGKSDVADEGNETDRGARLYHKSTSLSKMERNSCGTLAENLPRALG